MSNSNSNNNSNPHNSADNSSSPSPSLSAYGGLSVRQRHSLNAQSQPQMIDQALSRARNQDGLSLSSRLELMTTNGPPRSPAPGLVYIVTSNFTSQTTTDGASLSESDIVGFQILAVFSRIEDANSYAEHECEEIDAGVRRRRSNPARGVQEGEGIRAEAVVRDDGTICWNVEDVGQIDVGQWVVQ